MCGVCVCMCVYEGEGLGRERGVTADGVCYWYFDNTVLLTCVHTCACMKGGRGGVGGVWEGRGV